MTRSSRGSIAAVNVATAAITLFIVDVENDDPAARSWSLVVLWLDIVGIASAAVFPMFAAAEVVWFLWDAIRRFLRRLVARHTFRPVQDPALSASSGASLSLHSSITPASAASSLASLVMDVASMSRDGPRSTTSTTARRPRRSRSTTVGSRTGSLAALASRDLHKPSPQLFVHGGRGVNIPARVLLALSRPGSAARGPGRRGAPPSPPASDSDSSSSMSLTLPGTLEHLQSESARDEQSGWDALLSLGSEASRGGVSRDVGGGGAGGAGETGVAGGAGSAGRVPAGLPALGGVSGASASRRMARPAFDPSADR